MHVPNKWSIQFFFIFYLIFCVHFVFLLLYYFMYNQHLNFDLHFFVQCKHIYTCIHILQYVAHEINNIKVHMKQQKNCHVKLRPEMLKSQHIPLICMYLNRLKNYSNCYGDQTSKKIINNFNHCKNMKLWLTMSI